MILVNNQAGAAYAPLDHAPWNGLTPTDLVFPFFLFAVGNALSFVMPRFRQQDRSAVLRKICKRSALIFLIGFLLNWFPFFRWDHDSLVVRGWTWVNEDGRLAGVRVMGVLQRIALCYLFGALIIYFGKIKGAFATGLVLLVVYWVMCILLGNATDPYSLSGYFGTAVDKAVFGAEHLYHGEGVAFDPEGLASTIAAITQVIFGFLTGWYIQREGKRYSMLRILLLAGLISLALGYAWSFTFPLNKKIWTSSFVLVSTGYAILCLIVLIFGIEFQHWRAGWGTRFFDVFGKNPLFIFALSGLVPRALGLIRIATSSLAATPAPAGGAGITGGTGTGTLYTSPLGWFFSHVCTPLTAGNPKNASLLYALILVLLYWAAGYFLDRRKIYIRV